MNIMHIIAAPAPGGAETLVKDLAIEQKKRGHMVHICFLETAEESERDLNFALQFMAKLNEHGVSFSFLGPSARQKIWRGIFNLRHAIRRHRPQVIHSHLYWGLIFLIFVRKKFRVVYTHHNVLLRCPRVLYYVWNMVVDRFVAISSVCRVVLEAAVKRRTDLIYNGVSSDRIGDFGQSDSPQCDKHIFRILAIGALTPQKNHKFIIDSLADLRVPRWTLDIAGEGELLQMLQERARGLGIAHQVRFLGAVTNIPERLKEADLLVMGSQWEGFPISLLEAGLAGLPVVVTDVGGCREIVAKLKNGFVVSSFQTSEFSQAIKRVHDDPSLAAQFRMNALVNSTVFSIEHCATNYERVYNSKK